jgi:hypothetical protein
VRFSLVNPRFPETYREARHLWRAKWTCWVKNSKTLPHWFLSITAVKEKISLDTLLAALRTITREWQNPKCDESVRGWELPLVYLLRYIEVPAERRGEVVETVMAFVAVCDDTRARASACETFGLPLDRWATVEITTLPPRYP